jgi:hypothetical protein
MNYERCQNGCQFRLPKEITPNLEEKKKKKKKIQGYLDWFPVNI